MLILARRLTWPAKHDQHRRIHLRSIDRSNPRAGRIHRRIEFLVSLLVLAGVAIALSSADGAEAATGNAPRLSAKTDGAQQRKGDAERVAGPRIVDAKLNRSRIILGARRGVGFRFELAGKQSRKIFVKVVRVGSGKVKRRFRLGTVKPGVRTRIGWDGRTGKRGYISQGKYAFQVYSDGQRASAGGDSGSLRFDFFGHRFPLFGHHSYGDGFGAGRGHQGQDIFAKCGTPVVAARAGRIQIRKYQSAAGYYVVVDGKATGQDYVYMHMRKRGRPPQGSRVAAGEQIGIESDTGDASGCHLHFELWTKPGWYEGGRAKSPTRALKRWDKWS